MPRSADPTRSRDFPLDGGRTLRLTWSGTGPIVYARHGTTQLDQARISQDISKEQIASKLMKAPGIVVPDEFMAALVAGPAAGKQLQAR